MLSVCVAVSHKSQAVNCAFRYIFNMRKDNDAMDTVMQKGFRRTAESR